jgi:exportin-2 (importin alpha re-exporter)
MREHIHVAGAIGAILVREFSCLSREALTPRLSFNLRSTAYTSLGKLFSERQHLEIKKEEEVTDEAITAIDFEEQGAGYQAAFSRLAASESAETDPVAYVQNPLLFLQQGLERLTGKYGHQVQMLISVAEGGQIG